MLALNHSVRDDGWMERTPTAPEAPNLPALDVDVNKLSRGEVEEGIELAAHTIRELELMVEGVQAYRVALERRRDELEGSSGSE